MYENNYQAKLQRIKDLLDQFPNYHGEGYNYTKAEVEAWLEKVRKAVE